MAIRSQARALTLAVGKIDLTESRMRYDRRPAKGLRYPIFDVARKYLAFLHNIYPEPTSGSQIASPKSDRLKAKITAILGW